MTSLLTKKCSKCGKWKDPADFHVRRASKDGLMAKCKMCNASHGKMYRATSLHYALVGRKKYLDKRRTSIEERLKADKSHKINRLRRSIAVEICTRLGIDLDKLAKERYDA